MAEVDAEQRRAASPRQLGRAQDRAVAAEHDDELEVADLHGLAEQRDRLQIGRGGHDLVVLVAARAPA